MSTGLKANNDGSAAIQVGGTDYITLTSGGAATFLTSPTTVQAGTAAAPSITFTGDTNTGIYSPGADRIGFAEGGVQVGEFDASGNFQFNSGYGSVATAYGCRAWVNFNGTANSNLSGSYTQNNGAAGAGTIITVTATAHGLIAGNAVYLDFTIGTSVDGAYTVTSVTNANVFVCTGATSLNTSGNVTLIRSTIRASGNVSSVADNAVGDYTINFSVAMPDANYSTQFCTYDATGTTASMLRSDSVPSVGNLAAKVRLSSASTLTDVTYAMFAFFR